MYELIILSLLMRGPAHGYLIAKIINDMIGPYARMSNGRLYPLLARLEEEGLIAEHVETAQTRKGERQVHRYEITEEGRKRFHDLMMDTTSNPGDYQKIFWHKVPMLSSLKLAERLYLLDHYINYCQAHVLHIKAEADDLVREMAGKDYMTPVQLEATLSAMNHAADLWRLEMEWARQLREREVTQAGAEETEAMVTEKQSNREA